MKQTARQRNTETVKHKQWEWRGLVRAKARLLSEKHCGLTEIPTRSIKDFSLGWVARGRGLHSGCWTVEVDTAPRTIDALKKSIAEQKRRITMLGGTTSLD